MTDATRQIRQMVDFIMLEAREKAHEIRTKASLLPLLRFLPRSKRGHDAAAALL